MFRPQKVLTMLIAILLVCSVSGETYAKGKSGIFSDLFGGLFGDGYISNSEFIDMISDGQVLCYEPKSDASCSWAEVYSNVTQKSFVIAIHYKYGNGEVLEARYKAFFDSDRLCEPSEFKKNNISFGTYRSAGTLMQKNPLTTSISVAEVESMLSFNNMENADACYRYKRLDTGATGFTALRQFRFVDGEQLPSTEDIWLFPAGFTPVLY
ncbi:hypothetical protein [Maritalea porphyrae]|uniref:hypothetical protein n=1 Tax=Maritalea porphyrae TaxID=880732 RepID=UPI0022AEE8B1|nr:hypothetical protein [Maritalea porphyrae]MCZ4274209.1 hypothetical protein [Maritalea porphyrae]